MACTVLCRACGPVVALVFLQAMRKFARCDYFTWPFGPRLSTSWNVLKELHMTATSVFGQAMPPCSELAKSAVEMCSADHRYAENDTEPVCVHEVVLKAFLHVLTWL